MMETFIDLLKDPAHWEFEIFLIIIFDVIVGLVVWPFVQKALTHHKSDHERLEDLEKEVKSLKERIK
jgi:membrane protein implicated in regulation of membrane protease activity